MIYLISYDIVDDRKRYKLHKLLKNYGERNQYSVFECDLDKIRYVELIYKLNKVKIELGDSIMVYSICDSCKEKIIRKGNFVPINEKNMIFYMRKPQCLKNPRGVAIGLNTSLEMIFYILCKVNFDNFIYLCATRGYNAVVPRGKIQAVTIGIKLF